MSGVDVSTMERIAAEAAEKTVMKFLLALGVDASTPGAMLELQKDFAHVRETRVRRLAMNAKVGMTVVGSITTGILAALWFAVNSYLGKGH